MSTKIAKTRSGEREPFKTGRSGRGISLPKPKPATGQEGEGRPQARVKNIASSSTGVSRLDPPRSDSIVGWDWQTTELTLPLALPMTLAVLECVRTQAQGGS